MPDGDVEVTINYLVQGQRMCRPWRTHVVCNTIEEARVEKEIMINMESWGDRVRIVKRTTTGEVVE